VSDDSTLSIDPGRPPSAAGEEAHLFVIVECDRPSGGSSRHALGDVDEVVIGRGADRATSRQEGSLELRIPDARLSSRHARLVRDQRRFTLEDLGSKNGSLVNGVRQSRVELRDGDLVELGHTFFRFRAALPRSSEPDVAAVADPSGLTSLVPSIESQLARLRAIAPSPVPVLVLGETGTGKELAARAVHELSRRSGRFVPINCGALPATLVESELFGYRKGAFSGATEDRPGLVRSADGGTLFLDEIGDLAGPAQAALLRVLQEKEVLPVGGTKAVPVDLRVIAATHRDLEAADGQFRSDLLGRLRGFELRLVPLRERLEDFGVLVASLLGNQSVTFAPEAMRALLRSRWPLNIRQLQQSLSAAAALSGGRILLEHLPEEQRSAPGKARDRELSDEERERRDQLIALFEKHGGNLSAVARELGKDRVQIRRWIKLYGIDLPTRD
jgi:transcriptional regulator with GAF, ATPase, and Fis domain